MKIARTLQVALGCSILAAVGAGCGDNTDIAVPPGGGGEGGSAGASGGGGTGGVFIPDGGGGTGGTTGDPCATIVCDPDQHCEVVDGGASCVPNTCADLNCGPTEVCEVTANGAICRDIGCTGDVDCPENQYCDGTICADDVCTPGELECNGDELFQCDPNGGGQSSKFTCGSGSPYYVSQCSDVGGIAACPCEDDWDCPANTICDAGICTGTGRQPTCSLPPEDFADVLPTNEITWGGTGIGSEEAVGSAFPSSAQVVVAPVVANLDDDNGDGLIDERDFPEIIFSTFCNHDFTNNGILRAIHGGGPNKGQDYFASCGTTLWNEGDDPTAVSCTCANADLDSTASLAVGDLDYDGVPEIVALLEGNTAAARIYSNTGEIIATSAAWAQGGANPAPTLANMDNDGFVEIAVGRSVWTLGHDTNGALQFVDRFEGTRNHGTNGQGPVSCVANLIGDSKQELVAGATVYRFPQKPAAATSIADCTGTETGEEQTWCNGELVEVWHGPDVNSGTVSGEGFCAVADILGVDQDAAPGPNNPLDGLAEVLSITSGNVQVFNGQTGELKRRIDLGAGTRGGPPNIDDFDGDGFPEMGTAASTAYVVTDFQDPSTECPAWTNVNDDNATLPRTPPSTSCTQHADCGDPTKFACNPITSACVCLHNSWRRATEDDSSQVTGSTVFDFNGDGAAEVVYNDECRFRVYDGPTGLVYLNEPSESRTRIEYPVVADVDNDGNAEIVFATTNESGFCSQNLDGQYNNGLEVWGDSNDLWVSARRIWNQHAYHVTNVTESGMVPVFEPESWQPYNGRIYNTYRSNPRSYGVAPDLTVQAIQVSSPDAVCGQLSSLLDITVQVANIGDLRVGPGVVVAFYGTWNSVPLSEALLDGAGQPLTAVIQNSIEPGQFILLTVGYDAANNSPGVLPDEIRVVIDDANQERECDESNNELTETVDAGSPMPDLRIEIGLVSSATCPDPVVPTTVYNDGSADADNVVVRYYQGDPAVGGTALHEEVVPNPIPAGGSVSFDAVITNFPQNLSVLIYGVVDPDNVIEECNDGNNKDSADDKVLCGGVR